MTVVIGFSWPIEHDNSVAAIVDGRLVFAYEEERRTRHKHSPDEAPINSMVRLFEYLKGIDIGPNDIDAYAVNFDNKLMTFSNKRSAYLRSLTRLPPEKYAGKEALKLVYKAFQGFNYLFLSKYLLSRVFNRLGVQFTKMPKVFPVEHHLSHAASAYFSGFNKCACVTLDGAGEEDSTVVWNFSNGNFEKILAIHASFGSLGFLYEAAGKLLGYDNLEGPGKLMGLAPYGQMSSFYDKLREIVHIQDRQDLPYFISADKDLKRRNRFYIFKLFESKFPKKINWNPRGELSTDAANLAWATQKVCEEAIISTAKWTRENVSSDNLVLSGGVALNAKANMGLHYSKLFNDMFIFPAANDAGGPIGAAAYVYEHVLGEKMKNSRLRNVYLGPDYHDQVEKVVKESKWNAEYVGDDTGKVAQMVAEGKIVTWYQGRCELGPRALGNRSIIADPRRKEMWRTLNQIKGREWWRPLAPSLLAEDAKDYFVDPVDHEFMILMFKFKEQASSRVPAVVHVDGTARPQTVTPELNKRWYDLIKSFKNITGEGLIINTSFNLAGEPLVETPYDALRSFSIGGFDAIYLDGWIIKKY